MKTTLSSSVKLFFDFSPEVFSEEEMVALKEFVSWFDEQADWSIYVETNPPGRFTEEFYRDHGVENTFESAVVSLMDGMDEFSAMNSLSRILHWVISAHISQEYKGRWKE